MRLSPGRQSCQRHIPPAGDGRIEGVSRDGILEGEWLQDGGSGRFTVVLAPDGKSFAGRYATGTYWNGARVKTDEFRPTPFYAADTPRNALRTIIMGAIIGADIVGIPYEGVVAGLGVGGLALAIAARDTVSNFFGAAVLLAERPFKRGDYIELDGRSAIVEEVGLRSSRMRLFDDAQMIIPNAKVADNTIVNYGRRRKRQVLLTLSLKYGTPRERIDAFVSPPQGSSVPDHRHRRETRTLSRLSRRMFAGRFGRLIIPAGDNPFGTSTAR